MASIKVQCLIHSTSRHQIYLLKYPETSDRVFSFNAALWIISNIFYKVSQKTSKIIFVRPITTSNFHQIWQFSAKRWQIIYNYMRCTHFPPHLTYVNALPC